MRIDTDKPSGFARYGKPVLIVSIIIFLLAVIVMGLSIERFWMLESLFRLVAGWILYPLDVAAQIRIDWTAVATASVALILFTIGLHACIKWFWNHNRPAGNVDTWRPRSTLGVAALIVFSFVAGMSAVGLVHQITWLSTTDQALLKKSGFWEIPAAEPANSHRD